MGEFFKGWRWKAGCVTLVMACFALGIWFRARAVEDNIFLPGGDVTGPAEMQFVSSTTTGIMWTRHTVPKGENVDYPTGWYAYYYKKGDSPGSREDLDLALFEWRWRFCGFDFAVLNGHPEGLEGSKISYWVVPHWILIWLPLLLSACLLFGKRTQCRDGSCPLPT